MKDERGAVAVVVALVLVPLMGLAAFGVDVAGMWSEHQQLQNGADAAALAIAQNCGAGACGTPGSTAQRLVTANHVGPGATASAATSAGQVTVQAAATRRHLFAPVIGVDSSELSARATASWGSPDGGTAVLPLTFSWCEWLQQTGGGQPSSTVERTIYFTKSSGTTCTGPSNNVVPGGFGWLTTDGGTCQSSSSRVGLLYSDPGNAVPSGCSPSSFSSLQGKTVLLPVFDQAGDTGSNAFYHVYGYAAFTITGYDFVGRYSYNAKSCKGNDHCVRGYFTRFVDLTEAFTYSSGAPALGAVVVELTA
ncbi:pilus assembly protein TadG-related protein [Microlunatus capsulatus]|uniref:Flp pilus assembly protein TadG n=1 Tax=Microlunatus capsulatus TaxID=99117 RepID=A0ABS4Z4P6_9ACTN|nr:pilus assembly protein TadG-related protein [Microlunatus capsulatus]MBP2416019.1 Flp pilus assembly protein TadG [Microlunatus capsulatus]